MADGMYVSLSGCESSTMTASSALWTSSVSDSYHISLDSLVAMANKQIPDEEIRALADYCDGTLRALSE